MFIHTVQVLIFAEKPYSYTGDGLLVPGVRVVVPFNGRDALGLVLESKELDEPYEGPTLKKIKETLDYKPYVSEAFLKFCRFLCSYYHYPMGLVLAAAFSGQKEQLGKSVYRLTALGKKARGQDGEWGPLLLGLFKKGQASYKTLVKNWPGLASQYKGEGLSELLAKLGGQGYIERLGFVLKASKDEILPTPEKGPAKALTKEQEEALAQIMQAIDGHAEKKPILLQGVTGSGKTLVYVETILALLARNAGAQILVLVPEIALTGQMTRILNSYFPGQIALVHSNMSVEERACELDRIHSGKANILIGPRSAVLTPFSMLRLVIVDEEHDPSYKQNSGLCYNGRDVAVLRAKLEDAVIVLGSATPSLESLLNAKLNRYTHLELTKRALGQEPPVIEILQSESKRVALKFTDLAAMDNPSLLGKPMLHPEILQALQDNLGKGEQSLVLVGRRGYSLYLLDAAKNQAVNCPHCSVSLTLHRLGKKLVCHYCEYQEKLDALLGSKETSYLAVGFGSQRIEQFLRQYFPKARIGRLDSDNSQKVGVLAQTLQQFGQGELDILVGTQIMAKGHDFPNLTLTVLLEIDQILDLPDFRARERAFQLIVQAAGRAGRGHKKGRILLQSTRPSHPLLASASQHDFKSFSELELGFRKAMAYPPFTRMILWAFSSEDKAALLAFGEDLSVKLASLVTDNENFRLGVKIVGPYAPVLEKIRDRYRQLLLLSSKDSKLLHQFTLLLRSRLGKINSKIRVLIDVDPLSVL